MDDLGAFRPKKYNPKPNKSSGSVAMAECEDCHYRFPKPEMNERESTRISGFSRGSGPKSQIRAYYHSKRVWICSGCIYAWDERVASEFKSYLMTLGLVVGLPILLLVAVVIFNKSGAYLKF